VFKVSGQEPAGIRDNDEEIFSLESGRRPSAVGY